MGEARARERRFRSALGNDDLDALILQYAMYDSEAREKLTADPSLGLAHLYRPATCPGLLPNGNRCPEVIQKNEGCNHMTCTACKHEFCCTCLHPHTRYVRNPPPANAEGPCHGCSSYFCGTTRQHVWGHYSRQADTNLRRDVVPAVTWALIDA